ncbi:MAG: ABC transporter permease [Chloroflexota bacterium]
MGKRLKRLLALAHKEAIQILRDRSTLMMILALPLVELLLFAYAVDMTVDHIPTAVVDLSLDAESRGLIDALEVSGYFDVALYLESEAQVIRAIDEGRVSAGVVIPPDFAAQVGRGSGQVLILLDGSNSFIVQSGYSAAGAVVQARAMDVLAAQLDRRGGSLGAWPMVSSTRVLYNPNMDDLIFIVPGLAAMLLQFTAINLTALAVVRERELGTIEQLLATPVRPMELLISKVAPNAVVSTVAMLAVVLVGILWFGVPFQGDPWLFGWLSLLFIVSGLGVGLLISTVAQSQKQAQQITMLLMLLSLLLTGFIYPRAPMPPAIKVVSSLIPLTYFIRIIRGIFTKGIGLAFMWQDVVALVVYGAVVMVVAAATFKRRLD